MYWVLNNKILNLMSYFRIEQHNSIEQGIANDRQIHSYKVI